MIDPTPPAPGVAPSAEADQAALADALQQLLAPLARLVVAQGLPHAVVDELLRRAVVGEAHAAHPQLPEHRRVSRVATATGLNRREVARLLSAATQPPAPARSPLNEVFAHWSSHPDYLDANGQPRPLPRTGPAPSFEALAHTINRDVHPRSYLEELVRLGLAEHDAEADEVWLLRRRFVPRDDVAQMLGYLGQNVGDHLAAAVANVGDRSAEHKPHFEQAVFGEGLSPASVAELREAVRGHWKRMAADLVLRIEALVARDEAEPAQATERVRIGLFSFHAPTVVPTVAPAATSPRSRSGPPRAAPETGPQTALSRGGPRRRNTPEETPDDPPPT